ncbi:hypothetical protein F5141DRAFT_740983 [Pisolithus sp. B1]|nr:hypothetical protein F5141DRAFT_740983 [Pisolithus sp. B1]
MPIVYPPHSMASSDDVFRKRADLKSCPPGSNCRGAALFSLAVALRSRFTKGEKFDDLDEAITLLRGVLELRPSGHPDRSSVLRLLVLCLLDRYENQGVVGDLEEAVALRRAALELYPPSHPSHASSLHDLAQCLGKHFLRQLIAAGLNEAIALEQEALQLLTPGDPSYDVSRRRSTTYSQMKINPRGPITSSSAPDVAYFDINQVIRGFALKTLKTMSTRLLHTLTGVLCTEMCRYRILWIVNNMLNHFPHAGHAPRISAQNSSILLSLDTSKSSCFPTAGV